MGAESPLNRATCKDGAMSRREAWVAGLSRNEVITLVIGVPVVVVGIILAKPLVTEVLNKILNLQPTLVYVVVGLLVFAEAAIFVGFIFPGETAVILGGVVASSGRVDLWLLLLIVVVAAIIGDSVGYGVGHAFGDRLLGLSLLEHRRAGIDKALNLLRQRGGVAVFIGRFTAFLRAVMPGLAGASRLRYRTFLIANAAGGIVWGVSFTLLGYFLGGAYHRAEKYAGWVSTGLLIVVVFVAVALFIRNRSQEKELEASFEAHGGASVSLEEEIAEVRHVLDEPADDGPSSQHAG